MKEETSLTPQEVANILNIAKNTVYELIKRGELPAYRVGRKLRIDPRDVEIYKKRGKKTELAASGSTVVTEPLPSSQVRFPNIEQPPGVAQELVICGLDGMLDILTRYLERHPQGVRAFRSYVGSFNGLLALYQGKADMAGIHLWDGESRTYNIPFVRRLLPGIPAVLVHLACRMLGFYVALGNPKGIKSWQDLTRPDIRFINREKGSGVRVLLDDYLRQLGVDRRSVNGYEKEEVSHHAVASAVARGEVDVALGNEREALQVREIDFVPVQKERYEMVIKKEDLDKPRFKAVIEIIQSREFKTELEGLGNYDLAELGTIIEV